MAISIIVAMDINHLIGVNNRLPWHLPADLSYFKKNTLGKNILMGRKTYQSIGKPLPNRNNIVLSRNTQINIPNVTIIHYLKQAIELSKDNELMVIGGQALYQQILPWCQTLYITRVKAEFDGDAYFPSFNEKQWQLINQNPQPADDNNPYPYCFEVWKRKNLI